MGDSATTGVMGRLGGLVRGVWHGSNPDPAEWSDRGRLRTWETQHRAPRSGVWALRYNDGDLELSPPGSPHPSQWPGGDDPYHLVTPAGVTVEPDLYMPY